MVCDPGARRVSVRACGALSVAAEGMETKQATVESVTARLKEACGPLDADALRFLPCVAALAAAA
eukprot:11196147-Lingulodinium_polyedra.AAC.1